MSYKAEAEQLLEQYFTASQKFPMTIRSDNEEDEARHLKAVYELEEAKRNVLDAPLEIRRGILEVLPKVHVRDRRERFGFSGFFYLWQDNFLEEAFAENPELTAKSCLDLICLYKPYERDNFRGSYEELTHYAVRMFHTLTPSVVEQLIKQLPERIEKLDPVDTKVLGRAKEHFLDALTHLDVQLPDAPDEAAAILIAGLEAYWQRLCEGNFPLDFTKQMASTQRLLNQRRETREAQRYLILKHFVRKRENLAFVGKLEDLLRWLYETSPTLSEREAEAIFGRVGRQQALHISDVLFRQLHVALTKLDLEPPAPVLAAIRRAHPEGISSRTFKTEAAQLDDLLRDAPPLNPGEVWADNVLSDLEVLPATQKTAWQALLEHCETATTAKPNPKWQKRAEELLQTVGHDAALATLPGWLSLVGKPRTILLQDSHKDAFDPFNELVLRGLVWSLELLPPTPETARVLGHLVETSLKKVPGVGPRSRKTASAAVYTLSQLGGPDVLAQLARLRSRVLFKPVLKDLDRALDAEAAKQGLSREDLNELSVPTFGLNEQGVRTETLGDATAELRVSGRNVTLTWRNAAGKSLKSPPAAVKHDFAEELKELKDAQKDAAQVLGAAAARLDGLFLAQKSWPLKGWRERLLEHPLVGTVARRLIWVVDAQSVGVTDRGFEDVNGEVQTFLDDAVVTLWHPLEHEPEVMAWREWLLTRHVTQPFKQAHREVYRLTRAEEQTRVYSNRFAAHILKQHQFNALCALRGWRNTLRLMVDDLAPPAILELPRVKLRVEFWIEGVGDEYGQDTTDTGTYLYLSTDQVRFYRLGEGENVAHMGGGGYGPSRRFPVPAEPVPLAEVPPLVLSEVMRDVDLFVGVSSIANDPNWLDGGERHAGYWYDYGFGDLSASAETRKELLAELLPRLSLRDLCRLEGRFLVVQGVLRTYRIHLGSTNILMEPNSQYLCIVPNRGFGWSGDVFLPFEGDTALSVILSKAFMLADDTSITDPLIVSQIKR